MLLEQRCLRCYALTATQQHGKLAGLTTFRCTNCNAFFTEPYSPVDTRNLHVLWSTVKNHTGQCSRCLHEDSFRCKVECGEYGVGFECILCGFSVFLPSGAFDLFAEQREPRCVFEARRLWEEREELSNDDDDSC